MIIIGVADILPDRIRRLVYWNAFVPNDGESVTDMVPKEYVTLFDAIARQRAWSPAPDFPALRSVEEDWVVEGPIPSRSLLNSSWRLF